MFVGSDAIALAPLTDRVTYLEEGDWAVVTRDGAGLTIEGADESVYDQVRDALVEAQAPLRRMAPHRRALTELFERERT